MNPDEKPCPFCGETIKAVAVRCRYCHADLTDTAPAPAVASPAAAPAPTPAPPAALESWQVLDLLSHLVDKNLVVYEEDASGQGRYRLLETARQYSRERLMEEGADASDTSARKHRDYFLALAEETEQPKLNAFHPTVWQPQWAVEMDNLRAALEWDRQSEKHLRLASALWRFWGHGFVSEGYQWLEAALRAQEAFCAAPAPVRAKVLLGAGAMAWLRGDPVRAEALHRQCLSLYQEAGDKENTAFVLNCLGCHVSDQGNYAAAQALLEESVSLYRSLGDREGTGGPLLNLGVIAERRSDYAAAQALYEEALAISRELASGVGSAVSLLNLGDLARLQGDYVTAGRRYQDCLAPSRQTGDQRIIGNALTGLGLVARLLGDCVAARSFLEESLKLHEQRKDKASIANSLEAFALLAATGEQPERSARLGGAAEMLREAIHAPLPPSESSAYCSEIATARDLLGEEPFARAWIAGRAMTWEQAVEYALEDGSA